MFRCLEARGEGGGVGTRRTQGREGAERGFWRLRGALGRSGGTSVSGRCGESWGTDIRTWGFWGHWGQSGGWRAEGALVWGIGLNSPAVCVGELGWGSLRWGGHCTLQHHQGALLQLLVPCGWISLLRDPLPVLGSCPCSGVPAIRAGVGWMLLSHPPCSSVLAVHIQVQFPPGLGSDGGYFQLFPVLGSEAGYFQLPLTLSVFFCGDFGFILLP